MENDISQTNKPSREIRYLEQQVTKSLHMLFEKCSAIEFGSIPLKAAQKEFYSLLNGQMIDLCRSLPESTRINATKFILTYSGLCAGDELNFFRKYYAPVWSILYWIRDSFQDSGKVTHNSITHIAAIHSMAMFLHSLDNHLNDGELAANHLLLLLRSQAWHKMITAIESFSKHFEEGLPLSKRHIDRYYKTIDCSNLPASLEAYSDRFQGQMSTGLIAPELMLRLSKATPDFTKDLLSAYRRFGFAWRLLDDIKDVEEDMHKRNHSAVYHSLPEHIQVYWNRLSRQAIDGCGNSANKVCKCIYEQKLISKLTNRIVEELDTAAVLVQKHNLTGLAEEFRLLSRPLAEPDERYGAH